MARVSIAAAAASALLLWASSPAVGIGWFAWVALVPAATVALRLNRSAATRLAVPLAYALYLELLLVPAFPFGLADGQWGDPAIPVLVGGTPGPLVWLVAIPALGALLYGIGFGRPWGVADAPPRLAGVLTVLVPASAWTALELLRLKLDPGGLWGPLFLSQSGSPGAGLAAIGGPLLVTFAVVTCNYALAWTLVRRRPALALRPAALALACLGASLLFEAPASPSPSLVVAAVQPGYDTAEEDQSELRYFEPGTHDRAALDTIRDLGFLTRAAARQGAEVVVWPEAAMYIDPRRERAVMRRLGRLAADADTNVVVPYFDRDSGRSAVVAVPPGGRITAPQPKQRPMWFLGERAESTPARPLDARGVEVGTLLGVDAQDPAIAAELAAAGTDVIVSSTHDWLQLASQQRSMAAITARSTGTPVVRADWRYGSAIYDRDGRQVASAGAGLQRSTIVATVSMAKPTPYTQLGDAVGWSAVALCLAALVPSWMAGMSGRWRGARRAAPGTPP